MLIYFFILTVHVFIYLFLKKIDLLFKEMIVNVLINFLFF